MKPYIESLPGMDRKVAMRSRRVVVNHLAYTRWYMFLAVVERQ